MTGGLYGGVQGFWVKKEIIITTRPCESLRSTKLKDFLTIQQQLTLTKSHLRSTYYIAVNRRELAKPSL